MNVESSPGLQREHILRVARITRFRHLTPLLYGSVVLGAIATALMGLIYEGPLHAVVPFMIAVFALFRTRRWQELDPALLDPEEARRLERFIVGAALSVSSVYSFLLVGSDMLKTAETAMLLASWAAIVGVVGAFCLHPFALASRLILVILLAPTAGALLLADALISNMIGVTLCFVAILSQLAMLAVQRVIGDLEERADQEVKLTAATQRALNDFLSASHDYNFETDAEGRLTYVSANFESLTGRPSAALLGMPLASLLDAKPDSTRAALHTLRRALSRKEAVRELETLSRTLQGEKLYTRTSAVPIIGEDGAFEGYRGWIADVTDKRAAAAELAENEARFRSFATLAADCLWETDPEGCYTYISDVVTEWFGIPVSRVIGSKRGAFYDEASPPEFRASWEEHIATLARREPFENYLIPTRGGKMLSTDGVPLFGEDGVFLGYRGYTRDVTKEYEAKKLADQARRDLEETNRQLEDRIAERTRSLRERTDLLGEVLNTMRQGLVVLAADGKVEMMNDKAAGALPKAPWRTGLPFAPTYLDALAASGASGALGNISGVRELDEAMLAAAEPFVHYRRGPGELVFREQYVPRAEGGHVVTITDITADVKRQEELRRLKDQAEAASRTKSEFLANMSHEIRTPMNGVLGMTELLMATELTGKQRDMAEIILRSGDALLTIINDILDFSKLEAGKMSMSDDVFDARAAAEDVASLIAPTAAKKNLRLLCRIQPDLPARVIGDSGRFRQVVTNLVGNAVKFTDDGQVLIDVTGRTRGNRAELSVTVSDTGCGIPEDKLSRVFMKFEQVDSSASRRFEGTGLGLSISKKIADLMGGDITVTSRLGEGSAFTFSVSLPLCDKQAERPSLPEELRQVRALILAESDASGAIIEEQVEALGLSAQTVLTRGALMAALKEETADGLPVGLVLVEPADTDGDSFDLAERLAGHTALRDLPVIMIAADPALAIRPRRTLAGCVVKPTRPRHLLDAVISALSSGAAKRAAATADAMRAAAGEDEAAAPRRKAAPDAKAGAGPLLLVAEDNQVNRLVIETMLTGTDYRITFACDGEEALRLFEEIMPDIVLMDVSMPVMDGLSATRAIRARGGYGACVPIIGVTAHALTEDEAACRAAGMSDYLSKPLSKARLLEVLAGWSAKAA